MEVKEAIEHCDEIIKKMDKCECRKEHEELKEFLEELQEYEDTGLDPEQIRELKERDTEKEPEVFDGHWYKCPTCGMYAGGLKGNFCHRCGQRLKWED